LVSKETFEPLMVAMKKAAAALRDAQVPFFLAGGIASWARGGPPREHDVDFMLKEEDAEHAAQVLAAAGFTIERPPEGWLFKAWDGDVLVDVIYRPTGFAVDDEMIERADELEVSAVHMRVMSADDLLATKLCALSEHSADFEAVLEVGRSLREQIHWDKLKERTAHHPFARAYFTLVESLGIAA
jgi:predicted nucleotidyltransferase